MNENEMIKKIEELQEALRQRDERLLEMNEFLTGLRDRIDIMLEIMPVPEKKQLDHSVPLTEKERGDSVRDMLKKYSKL